MKADLSFVKWDDKDSIRGGALKLITMCASLSSLKGPEKAALVARTLSEAIDTAQLSPEIKDAALAFVSDVLPHVIEAALYTIPSVEAVVTKSWSCCGPQ